MRILSHSPYHVRCPGDFAAGRPRSSKLVRQARPAREPRGRRPPFGQATGARALALALVPTFVGGLALATLGLGVAPALAAPSAPAPRLVLASALPALGRPFLPGASLLTPGYLMVTGKGAVASFGHVPLEKRPPHTLSGVVAIALTPGAKGYWLATRTGEVATGGDANYYGSVAALGGPRLKVVSLRPTPDGHGYWEATSNGAVFPFGDAASYGPEAGAELPRPVIGMAVTADGAGYWLALANGSVYPFGDAGTPTPAQTDAGTGAVTGIAATITGRGYWLVSKTGKVTAFGDAAYLGSAPKGAKGSRFVAIAASPDGDGYWLLASDGAVFSFGPPFRGSGYGSLPPASVATAMVAAPATGQDVVSSGAFGPTSPAAGSPVSEQAALARRHSARSLATQRNDRTTTAAGKNASGSPHAYTFSPGPAAYPAGARGYDVSWPQCGTPLPPPARVAIVGVNGGSAFTGNPCFQREASWAAANLNVYINLNSPRGADSAQWATGPAGRCADRDLLCQSYNYGYNTAIFSVRQAHQQGARSRTWYLDVETASYWTGAPRANAQVVAGALAALHHKGLKAVVYSTTYQWDIITGGYVPGTSAWYPTGVATATPQRWCAGTSFAGGPVQLVQSAAGRFDGDYSC